MKLRPLTVACITLVLAGCNSGSTISPDFNLTGIASIGAPLVGVVVSATDVNGNVTQSTVTDGTGKYTMALKGFGPYVLTTPFNESDGTPSMLSSVYVPYGPFEGSTRANINPLTSLITSRVLGVIPSVAPSASQIKNAGISPASLVKAEQEIATLFQPIYTALKIPANETDDPVNNLVYEAVITDPLDNFFNVARFNVSKGQVGIGTDADRFVVSVPPSGNLINAIPGASIKSLATLSAGPTTTPIKNVIIIVGENHTFDTIFGTYIAPTGQTIKNLFSQGIVNINGTPGPNFNLARQSQAGTQTSYSINPTRTTPYSTLPQPLQIGALQLNLQFLGGTPDPHFPANLPNGPFQLTSYVAYDIPPNNPIGITTGNPVHRFFQMWQQTGGNNANLDMHTWVAVTAGQGGDTVGIIPANPGQGGELMAFLNMSMGDAPYLKSLAQQYAMSDNYHQSIMGGTGANFYALATADVPYFNVNGAVTAPFANQIENPNPLPGTSNFYIQDGYSGGSYVNCSDPGQPGVAPILAALSEKNVRSKCDPGKYYLVNNYGLGYDMDGNVQPVGPNNYTLPPQTQRTIAEALSDKGVSWRWYTGAREINDVIVEAAAFNMPPSVAQGLQYNNTGDPLVASQTVMNTPSLKAGLKGLTTFYGDVANGTLPSVSFVVPTNLDSGHPGYSVAQKYELFVKDVITRVKANPQLWAHTVILVTTDEGGGYFDSAAIQTQDFFGDGPRIPFIAVSPYSRTNYIDHTYHDHASILKFIERNWRVEPLTLRSRDNHPNPVTTAANPYMPVNAVPAVGDLMTMFEF